MNWTIYVYGDLSVFQSVLNAVAMIFSPAAGILSSDSGLGLGVGILVSLLISLVVILASTMVAQATGGGSRNNLATLLMTVIILTLVIGPKQTVQIEDIYSGRVARVDNVPLGVAGPAALISALTRGATEKLEQAFSTTRGNYISMGVQGFINPLNLLASLRAASLVADEHLTRSFLQFYRDCAVWRVQADDLKTSQDPFNYVVEKGGSVGGLTNYWRGGLATTSGPPHATQNPPLDGVPLSCPAAAEELLKDFETVVQADGKKAARFAAMSALRLPDDEAAPNTAYAGTGSGRGPKNSDLVEALALFEPSGSSTSTDISINQKGKNLFASPLIQTAMRCSNAGVDTRTYQECANLMIDDATRTFTAQSAGEATMFTRMVIPAMNMLLAMFFAFAPIVVIAAAMSASSGMGLLVKYFFFGIWTQSWMPMASVINYLIQVDAVNDLKTIVDTYGTVTMANAPDIYNALQRKLTVGFNLLASVPLISMAVLSGSFYALTSLSQKLSTGMGSGNIDEGVLERRSAQNGAMVSTQADVSQSVMGGARASGMEGVTPSLNVGQSLASAAASTRQSMTTLQQSAATSRASERVASMSTQEAREAYSAMKESAELSKSREMSSALQNSVSYLESQGMTREQAEATTAKAMTQAALTGKVGAELFGSGVSGSVMTQSQTDATRGTAFKTAEQRQAAANEVAQLTSSASNSMRNAFGTEKGSRTSQAITKGFTESEKEGFTSTTNSIGAYSRALSETQTASSSIGANANIDLASLGAQMMASGDNSAIHAAQSMFPSQFQMAQNALAGRASPGQVSHMAAALTLANNSHVPAAGVAVAQMAQSYSGLAVSAPSPVQRMDGGAYENAMRQADGMAQAGQSHAGTRVEKPALPTFSGSNGGGARPGGGGPLTPPGTPPAPGNLDHTDRINRDAVDGAAALATRPGTQSTNGLHDRTGRVFDHAAEVAGATAKSAENNVRNLGLGLDPMRNLNLPSKK